MFDVIVVGAGPAGIAAAKQCAESGLKTLLIEKKRLPRDKVCSGMIMGPLAHKLIKEEFGELPESVMASPQHLSGLSFHVPGIGDEKIENFTILTWRRNLDYWLTQKVQDVGAEIWQGARVVDIKKKGQNFSVTIKRRNEIQELESRFIIGADGAVSTVRRLLFPELKMRYAQIYQEHYKGEFNLNKNYFHWFYPVEISPASLSVHQKDDLVIIDCAGRPGQIKTLMSWTKGFLSNNYKFDLSSEVVWRGSCLEPAIYKELTSEIFQPAKGNALLVGDAAGLLMPVSGEGIGLGIKSGLLAAGSIMRALDRSEQADKPYLAELETIISFFRKVYPWFRRIIHESSSGSSSLPKIIQEAYLSTLKMI